MSSPPESEYLASSFDANTLRVPQLRSILLKHDVSFLSSAKKADLIELFEIFVKPQADTLLAASSRVRPSGKGITMVSENGSETASLAPTPSAPATKRRARSRKTTTQEPDPIDLMGESHAEPEPEPPAKRPRGRPKKSVLPDVPAPPQLDQEVPEVELGEPVNPEVEVVVPVSPVSKRVGRPRKSAVPKKEEPVQQDAEVEDGAEAEIEDDATPAPRSVRSRGSINTASPASAPSAPSSSRRKPGRPSSTSLASEINHVDEQPEPKPTPRSLSKRKSVASMEKMSEVKEESEKEDEPVVRTIKTPKREKDDQAFSDFNPFQSGSEDAAEREKRRRKSSMGLVKSRPAQPRLSEPAPPPSSYQPITVPPVSTPGILRRVGPSREKLRTPPSATRDEMIHDRDLAAAEKYNHQVSEKLNQITSPSADYEPQKTTHSSVNPETSLVRQVHDNLPAIANPKSAIPLSVLLLLLLSLLGNFKSQSASLGYCDPASNTNNIALTRENALVNAKSCIARRAAIGLDDPAAAKHIDCDVSALPLIPFVPRPTACAPCPPHAICENGQLVACEPEYILSSHPLSVLSPLMDGIPGMGPRSFPPTCRPDTAKKRMIGGLAKEMERELARGRGFIVCAGMGGKDGRKGEGERFGVQESTLRERFTARRDPKYTQEQFDEIFDAALNDLVEHDDVIESIDVNGISWYAAARTELTLTCRAKLEFMDLLSRWKSQLGSTAAVLATIAWIRSTMKKRKEEKYKAEELVQVVLKRLQDQERLHYSDPATTPSPFIPPAQLRDLVIPPTGSSTYRTRLWNKVNDLIEANANVAIREREVRGELWKTWEWQGVGERHVTWDQ